MRPCFAVAGLVVLLLAGLPLQAKDPPPSVAPQDRLLVLPVEFAYYKYGLIGTLEVVPDRSERAQRNLESSLQRALKRDESQQFVALPKLSTDEVAILNEHTDLLRLVAAASTDDVIERAARSSVYSIGNGLAFLAERAGVDRAIFVSGGRGDPSVDVAVITTAALLLITQWPLIPAGNEKVLSAVVVDLRSGDVLQTIVPDRGFAGEPEDVAGANTWMRALFEIAPDRVHRQMRTNGSPAPERPVRRPRPRRGFVVTLPIGWESSDSLHLLCFHRHHPGLENICVDDKSLGDALGAQGVTPDADPLKVGEVAVGLLKTNPRFADMEVLSLTRARVAGRDGFRAELASRLNLGGTQVRERHVVYGVTGPKGAHLVSFDAPAIYYFDHHLGEFETMVTTLKLL